MKNIIIVIVLLIAIVGVWLKLSSSKTQSDNYTPLYQIAMQEKQGIDLTNEDSPWIKAHFERLFASLLNDNQMQVSKNSYAAQTYFNDTMRTFDTNSDIAQYFSGLKNKVNRLEVAVDKVLIDVAEPQNAYLYWEMTFNLTFWGSEKEVISYGISHVRFDANKRIILHQDFWDSNNSLYHALPYVGRFFSFITPIREKM